MPLPISPQRPGTPSVTPQTPAPTVPVRNVHDDILLLGMNEGASYEARRLRGHGHQVTLFENLAQQDVIETRDVTGVVTSHNLALPEGCLEFAQTLGLPAAQAQAIAEAIYSTQAKGRDELAQLAREWARAEHGEAIGSRLILSGHNVGSGIWGDGNGKVTWDALGKLARAMPVAARSVEDLLLACCYSGGQPAMEKYRSMFPNVKTIWAYAGSSPGSWSGAEAHQKRWAEQTVGGSAILDRTVMAGIRKGEYVAVWSVDGGYDDGKPPMPIDQVRRGVNTVQVADFFSGARRVENPQVGPLRDYYNAVQRLVQHPDLPANEHDTVAAERDRTIRMLFYVTNVAPSFAREHEAAIAAGYQALGLATPDFSLLPRTEALASIQQFSESLQQRAPAPGAATQLLPLLEGLRDLTNDVIPETWI